MKKDTIGSRILLGKVIIPILGMAIIISMVFLILQKEYVLYFFPSSPSIEKKESKKTKKMSSDPIEIDTFLQNYVDSFQVNCTNSQQTNEEKNDPKNVTTRPKYPNSGPQKYAPKSKEKSDSAKTEVLVALNENIEIKDSLALNIERNIDTLTTENENRMNVDFPNFRDSLKIGVNYYYTNDLFDGINLLESIINNIHAYSVIDSINYYLGLCYFGIGNYKIANDYLCKVQNNNLSNLEIFKVYSILESKPAQWFYENDEFKSSRSITNQALRLRRKNWWDSRSEEFKNTLIKSNLISGIESNLDQELFRLFSQPKPLELIINSKVKDFNELSNLTNLQGIELIRGSRKDLKIQSTDGLEFLINLSISKSYFEQISRKSPIKEGDIREVIGNTKMIKPCIKKLNAP